MNMQTLHRPAAAAPDRLHLRAARPEDAGDVGALLHHAFSAFQRGHGFESDFDSLYGAVQFAAATIDDVHSYAVIAVRDRRIVGANFLSEGDPIRGVGPIAVAPDADGAGIGRRLMHDVIVRAGEAPGVRLLQDTFNLKSLSLYASLGFRAREPYVVLKGHLNDSSGSDRSVRPMEPRDLSAVEVLAAEVTGYPRGADVRRALSEGSPHVVEYEGRLTGYATDLGSWSAGHAVAESEEDFIALVQSLGALDPRPLHFLFPVRQAPMLRWLLGQGLRAEKQMLLMTRGAYREPAGVYVPSVLY